MISTAEFYGGAKDVSTGSSTYSITDTSTRVYRVSWTSGTNRVNLPPLGTDAIATIPEGGPLFYIVNEGSVSVTLAYSSNGSTTTATLPANDTAIVLLRDRGTAYLILTLDNA